MINRPPRYNPPARRFTPPPRTSYDPGDGKFPVFSTRGDMQNPLYLYGPGHLSALCRHFGGRGIAVVMGEVPVGRDLRQRQGLRVPDLLIAFGVDQATIKDDRGYSIEKLGKPPDFVLEVASESTGQRDITEKRGDYAAWGIPEYWRYDPWGGLYHGVPLAGDRLTGGVYQQVPIVEVDAAHHRGHSDVLGLDLCWEEHLLRFYDPAAGRYLRTFHDADNDRIAAERERNAERQSRLAAEEQLRELEAEVRRLRG